MIRMSKKPKAKTESLPISAGRVKSFVERVEKLEEERHAIGGDIRDVYAEAKGTGYDVKALRWLVQERRIESEERGERDLIRDTYAHALGMAVAMVSNGEVSLRKASKATGIPKSNIHRALAVPQVSQDAAPQNSAPQTEDVPSAPVTPAPMAGEGPAPIPDEARSSFDLPPAPYDDLAIPSFLRRAGA